MGVEYRAAIVVGLHYNDLPKETRDELLNNEELDAFSPYFDAPHCDCICGFSIQETDDYCSAELNLSASRTVELGVKFKAITGLDAKVFLTPYGW